MSHDKLDWSAAVQDSILYSLCEFPAAFILEHQSANGTEAPSAAPSARWATTPWWVIVIWTIGPEGTGRWGSLQGLGPCVQLLFLLITLTGKKIYIRWHIRWHEELVKWANMYTHAEEFTLTMMWFFVTDGASVLSLYNTSLQHPLEAIYFTYSQWASVPQSQANAAQLSDSWNYNSHLRTGQLRFVFQCRRK